MAFRFEGTETTLQINAGNGWHDLQAVGAVAGMLDKAEAFKRERGSCGVSVGIVLDERLPGWRTAVEASMADRVVRVREGEAGDGIEVRIEAGMFPILKPDSVMQTELILRMPADFGFA